MFHTAITIGFERIVYGFTEDDTAVQEVCASVMGDVQLSKTVVVTLRSMDGTAQGMIYSYMYM